MKPNWPYTRRWVGFGLMAGGGGLLLEHYISYGFSLHLSPFDHGLLGLALVILGAALASGRPGQRAPP